MVKFANDQVHYTIIKKVPKGALKIYETKCYIKYVSREGVDLFKEKSTCRKK